MVNWTNAYLFGITLETVYRNGQKIKVFVKDHSFERREKCRANKQKSAFVGFHETEALWRSHFFQHFTHSNIDNISKQHVHIISTRSLFNDETIEKEWSKRYTFDRLMFNRCFFFHRQYYWWHCKYYSDHWHTFGLRWNVNTTYLLCICVAFTVRYLLFFLLFL